MSVRSKLINKPIVLLCGMAALLGLAFSAVADEQSQVLSGDVANGRRLFRIHCAVCHGFDGSGKGPGAASLKIKPADLRDGSLMNARDDDMLFRAVQLGCKGIGCKGGMPAFSDVLSKLSTWDILAYLRTLHMPLVEFFPKVDRYLVKRYTIGKIGKEKFQEGQMERLEDALGKVDPKDLTQTVFTLFRANRRRLSPELVPQQPQKLAQLKKGNKIGYVLFMTLIGPRGRKIPIGLGLDTGYSIVKLVTTQTDPSLSAEYNEIFKRYEGLGKRGDKPDFNISKDKLGKIFDKAVTRVYMLAVEAANAYEFEERDRSWADGTF
jgi:mono/diheme cytochrome c family protein